MSKGRVRIRGFLGEQSFEITEGHHFIMASVAEAMVFNSTYRTERAQGAMAMEARERAVLAVERYRSSVPTPTEAPGS